MREAFGFPRKTLARRLCATPGTGRTAKDKPVGRTTRDESMKLIVFIIRFTQCTTQANRGGLVHRNEANQVEDGGEGVVRNGEDATPAIRLAGFPGGSDLCGNGRRSRVCLRAGDAALLRLLWPARARRRGHCNLSVLRLRRAGDGSGPAAEGSYPSGNLTPRLRDLCRPGSWTDW